MLETPLDNLCRMLRLPLPLTEERVRFGFTMLGMEGTLRGLARRDAVRSCSRVVSVRVMVPKNVFDTG